MSPTAAPRDPVFVDRSGHRRRVVGGLGAIAATSTAGFLAAVLSGVLGVGADAPPSRLPGAVRAEAVAGGTAGTTPAARGPGGPPS